MCVKGVRSHAKVIPVDHSVTAFKGNRLYVLLNIDVCNNNKNVSHFLLW